MNFIPEDLKEFKDLLSPTNLACFNSTDIFKQFLGSRKQKGSPLDSQLIDKLSEGLKNSDEDACRFILRFYFAQLISAEVVSIDLRRSNFIFEASHWRSLGSNTNYAFKTDFQLALTSIYKKFFHHSDESIIPDLTTLGLIQEDWQDVHKEEFEKLFFEHFYSGDVENMHFDFKQMLSSFSKIFLYLKSKKSIVPTPFAFLGLYLSTLYYTLGRLEQPINLKAEYLFAESACSNLSN